MLGTETPLNPITVLSGIVIQVPEHLFARMKSATGNEDRWKFVEYDENYGG
jgi:hypothetical protein